MALPGARRKAGQRPALPAAALVLALAAAAWPQAAAPRPAAAPPAQTIVQPRYLAGRLYAWRIEVQSVIRRTQNGQAASATLANHATVVMQVLSGGAPASLGAVLVSVRFPHYQTTVSGFGPFAAGLRRSAAATDQAVSRMHALEMRLTPGAPSSFVALGSPPAPRQARTILRELLETQALPLGAIRPGDTWRRQVIQKLPQFHFSFPLAVSGRFAGWRATPGGGWLAAVTTARHAAVQLPPSAIPDFEAAAAAGYAAQARLRVDGQTTSEYAPNDGVLTRAQSHTRTWLTIVLVGGGPVKGGLAAAPAGTEIQADSTGSVRLISWPAHRARLPSGS